MTPKISVLSAVHNEAKFIEDMIASVRAQSMEDWELIFVDDGSVDDTVSLIRSNMRNDSRIRLIAPTGKIGKVQAFNKAYAASTGSIVVLLAGDDQIPHDSLRVRYEALAKLGENQPSVAFFKIRTFSSDPRYDGMVLPRRGSSRSGGSMALNRTLSDMLFPIDESLVSEDIWLAHGSVDVATTVVNLSDIVLQYRIHAGNSNPRGQRFDVMTESLHARHRAWQALLSSHRFSLSAPARAELEALSQAEKFRYQGNVLSLLTVNLPIVERLAFMSAATPGLFSIRTRCYKLFSGHRGR